MENRKHIEIINKELDEIRVHMAKLNTDVSWIKKFQWLILSTSLGALILALIKLLMGV